jgi:hypothetical protein
VPLRILMWFLLKLSSGFVLFFVRVNQVLVRLWAREMGLCRVLWPKGCGAGCEFVPLRGRVSDRVCRVRDACMAPQRRRGECSEALERSVGCVGAWAVACSSGRAMGREADVAGGSDVC